MTILNFQDAAYIYYFFSFLFGASIGSFLNVVIYRLPRKKNIIFERSKCLACNTKIKFYDNIPIISFFLLRGRCRSCNNKISIQYPLVELIIGLLSVATLYKFKLSIDYLIIFYLLSTLIACSVIDIYFRIIPDSIDISGIILGLLSSLISERITFVESLLGGALGFLVLFLIAFIYEAVTKREGLGGGDVKLLAMIGAFLGYKSLLPILLSSSLIGAITGLIIAFFKGKDLKYAIPFGPFLAIGTLIIIFFGQLFPFKL